ncbi:hypothetical protein E2R51_07435 [Jeotgalibacillus sp. S-D1]|uniref:glycosyltransferase family 39 protein n=1 Tax=Jeotgalibacillus sp. S-D1 TaxID=2552189 RepID=UPI001059E8C5|nr:glycosyltransferase family 39 protein [Jeotgalibacillus sp. S-D1]TDL32514.1 hypothetical protein E2R51_07435 [Jeotgalibacillus sp. S-D1]
MTYNRFFTDKLQWLYFYIGLAILLGLIVSFSNPSVLIYSVIVLFSALLAISLSTFFQHPTVLIKIILAAISVRLILLIGLKIYSYQNGLDGFFPGDVDALSYHGDAVKALATHSWFDALRGNLSYTIFVGFLYNLFGIDMNIPQLINLGASVIIVPLLYEIGDRVGGKKFGLAAVLLWTLFPSAIFWSISLLKDAFVVLGMVLASFLVISLSKRSVRLSDLIIGASGVALISYMRPQFLLAIAIPIVLYMAFQFLKGRGRFVRNLVIFVVAIGIFSASAAGDIVVETFGNSTSEEGVDRINEIALEGGSGIHIVTLFPAEIRWLIQLPFSIFAPFPWQWLSFSQGIYVLSALEMLCWYFLYYFIWKNRKEIFSSSTGKIIFFYASSIFLAVSFSLPNIGSIYRYRLAAMAILLPLIFYKKGDKKKKVDSS